MTTIAWDGRFLASDSAKFRGSYHRVPGNFQKIVTVGGVVYACTGSAALFHPLIEWHKAGAEPADVPKDREDRSTSLLVFEGGKCRLYCTDLPYPEELIAPDAWGVGDDYAIGAMLAGANARRAVEIAKMVNPQTAGDILVIDLARRLELIATE